MKVLWILGRDEDEPFESECNKKSSYVIRMRSFQKEKFQQGSMICSAQNSIYQNFEKLNLIYSN